MSKKSRELDISGSQQGNHKLKNLLSFQNELAESLLTGKPGPLKESKGLRLTRAIRRSWCDGRTAKASRLTLMALPFALRKKFISDWVDNGGGTSSFFSKEGEAFLEFILPLLADPSHERSICLFELAIMRLANSLSEFSPPDETRDIEPNAILQFNKLSSMVDFYCEPLDLLIAIEQGDVLPPVSIETTKLLVAPGLPGFCQIATVAEIKIIGRLSKPARLQELLDDKNSLSCVKSLLHIGALSHK